MKQILIALFIIATFTGIYSCKKSTTTTNTKTTDINQIVGNWSGEDTSRVIFGDSPEPIACMFKKISATEIQIIGWDNPPISSDLDTLNCTVDSDLTLTVTSNNHSSAFLGMTFKQVNATHYTFTQAIHTGEIDGYLDKH